MLRTLILVAIGKIITRAPGVSAAKYMITSMIKNWNTDVLLEGGLLTMGLDVKDLWVLFLSCLVLLSVSLMQGKRDPREAEPLFPLGDLSGCFVLPDSFWRVWLEL